MVDFEVLSPIYNLEVTGDTDNALEISSDPTLATYGRVVEARANALHAWTAGTYAQHAGPVAAAARHAGPVSVGSAEYAVTAAPIVAPHSRMLAADGVTEHTGTIFALAYHAGAGSSVFSIETSATGRAVAKSSSAVPP